MLFVRVWRVYVRNSIHTSLICPCRKQFPFCRCYLLIVQVYQPTGRIAHPLPRLELRFICLTDIGHVSPIETMLEPKASKMLKQLAIIFLYEACARCPSRPM